MTPSSRGMIIAALTSSLQPSNLDKRIGFRLVLNLSCVTPGTGFISAVISLISPVILYFYYVFKPNCHLTVVGLPKKDI